MNKCVLFFLAALMIAVPSASAQYESDFKVSVNVAGTGLTITGYTGKATEVWIPARIQNVPVLGIGARAFYEKKISSVVIPEGVTFIECEAFLKCYDLNSVTLPSTIAMIEKGAFKYCYNIFTLSIPQSVTMLDVDDAEFERLYLDSQAALRRATERHRQTEAAAAEKWKAAEAERKRLADAEAARKHAAEQAKLQQLKQGKSSNALNNTTWRHVGTSYILGLVDYTYYFGNGTYRRTASGSNAITSMMMAETGTFVYTGNTVIFTPSDGSDLYSGIIAGNSLTLENFDFGDTVFTRVQ